MVDEQPLRRRWVPADEVALRDAFDGGLLAERNWCELKRELSTKSGANTEMARDLASLAVDGGTLIIGIDEKNPEEPLHPVALRQLAERVEQIAATKVHPPLMVEGTPVESWADSSVGFLIVHVPASPLAPHQVDGVYLGRGDKTKRYLPDAEVERLFERRRRWSEDASHDLNHLIGQRSSTEQRAPQLFIVARPVGGWPEMMRPMVGTKDWTSELETFRVEICNDEPMMGAIARILSSGWSSNFTYARKFSKTSRGAVMATDPPGRVQQNDGGMTLDVHEAGTLGLAVQTVGANTLRHNATMFYKGVFVERLVASVGEVLAASRIAGERVGYRSSWDIALCLTNMTGSRVVRENAPRNVVSINELPPGYDELVYQRSTRADQLELERRPGHVLERLLGLYLRGGEQDEIVERMTADDSVPS